MGAAAIEVGSDPEHHQGALVGVRRDRDDRLHEGGPLALVAAGGEDLLELIDGQYQPLVWPERGQGPGERVVVIPLTLAGGDAGNGAAELRERALTRSHQHLRPALGAGERSARQRRQEPGADQRGLAAPRRSDDRDQGGADQARHQVRHQPLAAEEVLGVGGVERRQAAEGADLGRRGIGWLGDQVEARSLAGELQLGDAAGDLGLRRAQAAALAGRPPHRCLQPLRRLRLGPAAGRPMDPQRHALALGHQGVERHRDSLRRRVELGDLDGGVDPQRAQESLWAASAKAGGPCSSRCSTRRSRAESRDPAARAAAASRIRDGEASSASSRTTRVGRSLRCAARIASRAASGEPVPAA